MAIVAELPLRGAGGEPVDFARTIVSHGVAELPPNELDVGARTLVTTLAVSGSARTVRLTCNADTIRVESAGRVGRRDAEAIATAVRHMFRLDEDLSAFYARVRADAELDWCCVGAGRMLRAPTVFEDVVKTICTTNTAWSGTRKMTAALVANLGAEAPGGRRSFPSADVMAQASDAFYRDVVRAGYRGQYLRKLAADVADGRVDLERLNDPAVSDDEAAATLLGLPGVGPYAAAHVMLTSLGRYSRLVLDSWTRPTYQQLSRARRMVADATIERRFKRYGPWAGLAFWLFLTRNWVDDGLPV